MTISFSYVYLNGLQRGNAPPSPVIMLTQRSNLLMSPRKTFNHGSSCEEHGKYASQDSNQPIIETQLFIKTVSAISSALCPVTILSAFINMAPRSSAWRRNTPQNVPVHCHWLHHCQYNRIRSWGRGEKKTMPHPHRNALTYNCSFFQSLVQSRPWSIHITLCTIRFSRGFCTALDFVSRTNELFRK